MSVAGAFVGGLWAHAGRPPVSSGLSESRRGGPAQPLGLRSIIVYKTIKGWVELTLGVGLLALLPVGLTRWLAVAAVAAPSDLAPGNSARIAEWLAQATSHHRIHLTIGVLLLDALVTLVEARALARRLWWAPWLVVVTVGSFLPFELAGWLADHSPIRALLLVVNALVVVYLASYAWRAHHLGASGPVAGLAAV